MKPTEKYENRQTGADESNVLLLKPAELLAEVAQRQTHQLGKGIICRTDYRPLDRTPFEIVVDATEGFLPLWGENLVLRWRFNTASLSIFQNPDAIKEKTRDLLNSAIAAWADAAPIRFTEEADNSDFEMVIEKNDDCDPRGCTL